MVEHGPGDWMAARRISGRNLAAFCRYAVLWVRYPQVRRRLFYVGAAADIRIERRARLCMGREVRLMRDCSLHLAGRLTVGDGVFFNRGCHLVAHEALAIGDHCLFGEGVSIHDESHLVGRDDAPIAERGFRTSPIAIGRNVWVGAKATILQGVTIGDNAVIGAHALVNRDVPANSLAVGVPARVARSW